MTDARADLQVAIRDPGRGGRGGVKELSHLHAVAGSMDVNVAGL